MSMVVTDGTKLNAGMTATANKIRQKTGGSAPIAWDYKNDTGFAAAIDAIQTGGVAGNAGQTGGGADRSLMNYQFASLAANPCIIKEGGKWLSNFSVANTFMRPAGTDGAILKPDWSQPFEIQILFRITNMINRSMVLFGAEQGFFYCPSIEVSSNYNGIWCGFSTNGNSWTDALIFAGGSDISIALNTIIRINAVWDGTNYAVTVFDGTNTVTKSVTPAKAHYFYSAYNMEFGGINKSSQHCAQYVEIDLENTFIKQNNVMIWGCSAE